MFCRWQGLCKPYNGSVCRDQLGFSMVYHNLTRRDDDDDDYVNAGNTTSSYKDDLYVNEHENIVLALLAEMHEAEVFMTKEGTLDTYCLVPAQELLCHFAFPDCQQTELGLMPFPLPLCR